MSWVLFAVLAILAFAISNLIDKYVLTKWVKPSVTVMTGGVFGLLAGFSIYFLQGFSYMSYSSIAMAAAAGTMETLSLFLYFKAVKTEEISRVVPLYQLTPIFVLVIAAIFLGEIFTPVKYVGIFLLVIGAVFISSKNLRFSPGKAFWLMALAALAWSVSVVIIKHLLVSADFWTVFSYTKIGAGFSLIPFFYYGFHDLRSSVREHGKKFVGVMSLNEIIYIGGLLLYVFAISVGYVTLVSAFGSLQPLFVLVFALILSLFYPKILKEEIGKSIIALKLAAIILMFIGAVLIM